MQQLHVAYDFSQLCIKNDTKLRLQRNRMVLDNIQKEIVEEEQNANQLEMCFERSNTEESLPPVESSEAVNNKEIYINYNSDEMLLVFSDEEQSTVNGETVPELQKTLTDNQENSTPSDTAKKCEKIIKINRRNRKARARNFQCPHCPDQFVSETKLKKHSVLHDPNRKYTCETCNKSFSKKYHLSFHMRTHIKNKKFSCEECGKQYAYLYLLKQHSYKHSNEKPFPCKICGKGKQLLIFVSFY